jgi:hypothetical protein
MNRDRAAQHSQSAVEAEEVNIAQSQKFDIAVNYTRRRNACGYWTLAPLELADAEPSMSTT